MSTLFQPLYGSNAALTITLASLAATSYRQSAFVNNSTNYADAFVYGHLTSTAGTANTVFQIFAYWSNDGGSTYSSNASGSDASYTLSTSSDATSLWQLTSLTKTATTASTHYFQGFSFCQAAGLLFLPQRWGVIVYNGDSAALNATAGNHVLSYQGVNWQGN